MKIFSLFRGCFWLTTSGGYGSIMHASGSGCAFTHGEMAEWSKAPVLKTGDVKASVGSNPTLSARLYKVSFSAMQKYPSGRRGSPAKGVGCVKSAARVQIPPSAPKNRNTHLRVPVFSLPGGFETNSGFARAKRAGKTGSKHAADTAAQFCRAFCKKPLTRGGGDSIMHFMAYDRREAGPCAGARRGWWI